MDIYDRVKKFDEDKSLLPIFSHINEFAFQRDRWALRRIFGYEFPSSTARNGAKLLSQSQYILERIDKQEAIENEAEFDANCSLFDDPKKVKRI